jgi:multicomponent Na+:H+ antiporter subunit E
MAKIATFLVMLAFWIVLSGKLDGFHLSLGVLSSLLVAWFSHDLLFFGGGWRSWMRGLLGLVFYLPGLFWEIVLATLHVAYVALHPRMYDLIDPQIIRFRTRLKKPISKVALAQSITLTPGTITVEFQDDEFIVYALTQSAADGCPGSLERRVARALEFE